MKLYATNDSDFYKIKNLSALINIPEKEINLKSEYKDECFEQISELLKNDELKIILEKISSKAFRDETDFFATIDFDGDFSIVNKTAYAYVSGDSRLFFVTSLNYFSEGYQTEKEIGLTEFTEI
jgi:hypothetical protein